VVAMGQSPTTWNQKGEPIDFYTLKGTMENLFANLSLKEVKYIPVQDNPSLHPGKSAQVILGEKVIGIIGEVHPDVIENFKLPEGVIVFQLDATEFISDVALLKKYQPLPKYPGVERDLAVVAKEGVKSAQIQDVIKEQGGNLLKEIKIFDLYQGAQIEAGYKSIAFTLKYQANDRTLTDGEVNKLQDKIINELKTKLEVEMRL